MSDGYTKLFGSLIHSTVWREKDHTRLVWITMLALADRDGEVAASVPGLADAARVTLEQCEESLLALSSPDKYSRSKAHEGRRIAEVPGGWKLLNYEEYRRRMGAEEQREKAALRQQRARDRKSESRSVTLRHASSRLVTESNASHDIAEAEAEAEKKDLPLPPEPEPGTRIRPVAEPRGMPAPFKHPRVLRVQAAWKQQLGLNHHRFRGYADPEALIVATAIDVHSEAECMLDLDYA